MVCWWWKIRIHALSVALVLLFPTYQFKMIITLEEIMHILESSFSNLDNLQMYQKYDMVGNKISASQSLLG